jgi:hypothetical protein
LEKSRYKTAFVLSLLGGLLIIFHSVLNTIMFSFFGVSFGFMGGMMSGFTGMMGSVGFPFGFMVGLMLVGLIAGIIVFVGSLMLYLRPLEHFAWGTVILVFSIISFLGMGGFVVGAVLGIIGGSFAISKICN